MSLRASDSITSTARMSNEPSYKIELLRSSKSSELRRLRGTFTFDEFVCVVRNMWNSAPRKLVIEYDDEEGDRIRVGSEAEWQEAVGQYMDRGMPSLRLYVRRYKGGKDTKPASDSEDEADPTSPPSTKPIPASGSTVPAAAQEEQLPSTRSSPDLVVIDPPTVEARTVPPLDLSTVVPPPPAAAPVGSPVADPASASQSIDEASSENERTIDLLSRLYDCDAAREMMDVFSTVNFAPVVTRRVDGVAQEVHVDVDRAALRHLTVMRTNQWIGSRLYEKAETTLEAAMRLWPTDSVIQYNIACAASLRGDVGKAVEMLTAAVDNGFDNIQQLRSDPDLEYARDHPDYVALLQRVQGSRQPAAPAPKPAAKKANAKPVPQELVAQVIAMFPDFSQADAEALLIAHNNNIRAAINSLLGSA